MSFTDGINRYCSAFEEFMNKDTIQDLRKEIDEMTCLVNGFRSENDRLKEENKRLEETNTNLNNELSELEEEQDDLKQEYKIAIDENNFFIKENARLEEEIEELKKENERRSYTILSQENKCLKEINSNFKMENKRLKKRIFIDNYNHVSTTRELRNEKLKFEEEVKNLKEENKNLRTENCWLEAVKKEKLQKEYAMENYCSELNNENLKLGEKVKKLKEENRQFKLSKNCLCDAKKRLEEANEFLRRENIELQNKLKNRAETKIYQLSAEDFAKTFKGQWTVSISPDEVSTIDFTVNNENDKDRLSYYLTYKDTEYDEPFDKIYKYLESYQIERVAIAKMLDKIRAEIKASKFVEKTI